MKKRYSIDFFNNLEGRWDLNRCVNFENFSSIKMKGTATFFFLKKNSLKYVEKVFTHLPGLLEPLEGYREYVYEIEEDGINIYFSETGLLFHKISFRDTLLGTARHFCKKDIYEGSYDFRRKNRVKIIYMVTGPSKNYQIETNFKKALSRS